MTAARGTAPRLVVLGLGPVGLLLARLTGDAGWEVTGIDRTVPADAGSAPLTVLACDAAVPGPELRSVLGRADAVVVALPERAALAAAPVLAACAGNDVLVVETLSHKDRFLDAARGELAPRPLLSLNPLFHPALGWQGNRVTVSTVGSHSLQGRLLELIRGAGATTSAVPAAEHDRRVIGVQAATHAALLGFVDALARLGTPLPDLLDCAPPPSRALLALAGRVLSAEAETYWDIQSAGAAKAPRTALLASLAELDETAVSGREERFVARFDAARGLLGDDLPHHAEDAARLLNALLTPQALPSTAIDHGSRGTAMTETRAPMTPAAATAAPGGTDRIARRSAATTDMYDRAVRAGLTGHTITGRAGKTVVLQDGSSCLEFVSCSYLGLEAHPRLTHAARSAIECYGTHFSSSRNSVEPVEAQQLERLLSEIYGGLHALVFNSVSSVHLGLLPLLGANVLPGYPVAANGPLFVVERTAHASMQALRGVLEQTGPVTRFRIEDPDTLADAMRRADAEGRTPVVLADGIGSMGGLIDVAHLQRVAAEHRGYVYIDDAHGISLTGRLGGGYALEALGGRVPGNVLLVGSLSKAFGGSGGFVLTQDAADVTVLRREANPMVFGHSNMLTHMRVNAESARMHLDGTVATLQEALWSNVDLFDKTYAGERLVNEGVRSPIRGLALETEEAAFAAAVRLREAGVLCFPVFYPVVARGTGMLRFALSATHTAEEIRSIAHHLTEA